MIFSPPFLNTYSKITITPIDERIFKRQEILNEETTLKTAIKIELRDAFKENPSLKDLQKETEFIAQTLFNELTQNHHQGNLNA
ncbi:restriction endonuclease subunit R [Helicobacter pylori]|nr:restriction endonuclease subunit R [Helicobacter pylori]